jgi:hypothetical protein
MIEQSRAAASDAIGAAFSSGAGKAGRGIVSEKATLPPPTPAGEYGFGVIGNRSHNF